MKKQYNNVLFVCDMDGTLLNSRHEISIEKIDALKNFVKNGGFFTVATGRSVHSVKLYSSLLPINCPGILYNGAVIYDLINDAVLFEDNLNDNIEKTIASLMKNFPGNSISLFHGDNIYFVQQNKYLHEHAQREKYKPVICRLEDVPKPWTKVLMAWEPERLASVEQFLNETNDGFRVVYSEKYFLEILNKGVTKGNALKILAQKLGVSRNCVIAAGDNLNDMELIQYAGLGVAVSNAHTDLKATADYCCCSHEENVILDCINQYNRQRE